MKSEDVRNKLTQVFQFLQALDQIKNPVEKDVERQLWTQWFYRLPEHECIDIAENYINTEDDNPPTDPLTVPNNNYLLKVTRPTNLPVPEPDKEISPWLNQGWDNCNQAVSLHSIKTVDDEGNETSVDLRDDEERLFLFNSWLLERNAWAEEQQVIDKVQNVFENIYGLYSRIQRESEQVELVLGDGILNWPLTNGVIINHPLLLQIIDLTFEPSIPQFIFTESDKSPELYSALTRTIPEIIPSVISNCLDTVNTGQVNPMEEKGTTEFFKKLAPQIAPKGEYIEGNLPAKGDKETPRISRSKVIFLRKRNLGFGVAIEAILDDLPVNDLNDIPSFLPRVFGLESNKIPSEDTEEDLIIDPNGEDEEVLFSKEANGEQLQIVKEIHRSGTVLVQGPPGTGKTHTIANLVGHFLAQGKSILITSHSSKALQVLREKVVKPLQPLCVSVLSEDSRAEFENSVNDITEKLSGSNTNLLETEANQLSEKRVRLLNSIRQLRNDLKIARFSEYTPIVLAGTEYRPIDAAKIVAEGIGIYDWIPSPISKDEPCPISEYECSELYRLNASLTHNDENNFSMNLPSLEYLLEPQELKRLIQLKKEFESKDLSIGEMYWSEANTDAMQVRNSYKNMCEAIKSISSQPDWLRTVAINGMNEFEKETWQNLQQMILATYELSIKHKDLLLEYWPHLPDSINSEETQKIMDEIHFHVSNSGKLSPFKRLMNPRWNKFIKGCTVNGYSPSIPRHFDALKAASDIQLLRDKMQQRWERQVRSINGPEVDINTESPEKIYLSYSDYIETSLNWCNYKWLPAVNAIIDCGFGWEEIIKQAPNNPDPIENYSNIIFNFLPEIIEAKANNLDYQSVTKQLNKIENALTELSVSGGVAEDLLKAVRKCDLSSYEENYNYLCRLHKQAQNYNRRNELLNKVSRIAPAWSDFIRSKRDVHASDVPPSKVLDAWVWRQLNDELDRRAALKLEDIQNAITASQHEIHLTTGYLVEKLAWGKQISRISDPQRLALQGWKMMINRIGRGTGARAPKLKTEARKLMHQCQTAVPVWIMPMARVVDNFNPSKNKFDVVIIDEASQADLMALIPIYMGKEIVIVGDDEQVSPMGVGQKVEELQGLIATMLNGIPNAALYDSTFSIYDLAMTILQPICLREHFRCVPEIINFSNRLSYNWKIKPLRDSSSVNRKPHLVDYRIEGATTNGKLNQKEASTIASLIVACTREPDYENASFGVISLLGQEQALYIDNLLRRQLEPTTYAKRKIQCGNSAHFQGDERDIIFLSMVDTCESNGPLSMRSDGYMGMFKKRYNVAASRARDQLWVVYSLNPETDLQENDLRLQLIKHAKDPNSYSRELEKVLQRTESDFEKKVASIILDAGYKVTPQWKVGSYRIDMVIEGNGKRLAVECDGDRWHTLDNLQDDLNRQAILERLDWTFVRIRGSQFYRNPDKTMAPVFERLNSLGITPVLNSELNVLNNENNDLLERIKRNAATIRELWEVGKEGIISSEIERSGNQTGKTKVHKKLTKTNNSTTLKEAANINDKLEKKQQTVELIPTINEKIPRPIDKGKSMEGSIFENTESITQILEKKGLSYVDKRDKGGVLWVLGGNEIEAAMKELEDIGYKFKCAPNGGRVTQKRSAWYYK